MPPSRTNLELLAAQLKALSKAIGGETTGELSAQRVKRVRHTITKAYEQLRRVTEDLDPIKQPDLVFDPSDPNVVGRLIAIAMIAQPRTALRHVGRFYGSGVYALYYSGDFKGYASISRKEHPIYVGKADPRDPTAKTAMDQGDRLSGRLSEHRKNIGKAASTLQLDDFECRALVVQSGWQASTEDYLIHLFKPIWNSEIDICYGFGKHGDDPKTRANLRSPWDTLHPGRDWAHRDPDMQDARPRQRILSDIKKHCVENPLFETADMILRHFLDEMNTRS